ncbi:unnamed protein product [Rotaria socialis]|uniref:Uncharacterized protein n=1 Tax=Rotaria socialis TaxID=392032 RepID=A0A820VL95_9BILA|nr:unnamed protein product [Rotaria socialis]
MLAETMTYHRELGNQITHEKLTGSAIFERPMLQLKSVRQNLILKQLCLYQHSARCPVALHVFLDCNPIYWCFIPLPRYEALLQDFASSCFLRMMLVPEDRSIIIRHIIETFFIIHGEPKLNMICPLGGDPARRDGPAYDSVSCTDLKRPASGTTV